MPPCRPRPARKTGTPEADSASMSRYTVRTDISSRSASTRAGTRRRVRDSRGIDSGRPDLTPPESRRGPDRAKPADGRRDGRPFSPV
ncbi:hypothetical protein GCM10010129_45070 [Streptomyces fumigatiscleroticus]|nr:hypothetical protein GCM10010129_45070 [Streptomyces fumigatiscleroticus]